MEGPRPDKFQFAVLIPAGFGAGTPQQEHFKNAGALQKYSPEWAQYFQELKICGHGTILALTLSLSHSHTFTLFALFFLESLSFFRYNKTERRWAL